MGNEVCALQEYILEKGTVKAFRSTVLYVYNSDLRLSIHVRTMQYHNIIHEGSSFITNPNLGGGDIPLFAHANLLFQQSQSHLHVQVSSCESYIVHAHVG